MAYERGKRRLSAMGRVRLYALLLALPALIFTGSFFFLSHITLVSALLLGACLLIYLGLVGMALEEAIVRPLQTLANVVSGLREGDYSSRARRANGRDAMSELAWEVNALANLLEKQQVRSLEATALLARILEVMQSPLFAFDRETRLQLVNDAGLQLLGLSYNRCYRRSADELGLDDLLAAPDESIHSFAPRSFASGSVAARPARWLLRKAAFRQDGAPHTLLLLADVSQPLQEEERLAWKRLIRVLGHELSNSLAPIKSIAGSLRERVDSLEGEETTVGDFRRGLDVVESRADALQRFVQSYRTLAQLPPPQLRPVDVGPLLERVALLEQRLPVAFDPGPPVTLNADPDQLEQMFINLLANAVDASLERLQSVGANPGAAQRGAISEAGDSGAAAANGARLVRASWRLAGAQLLVVIEDRGLGIANSENLFVPFYTTKPKGSGVGLALAQQIARAHGGEIQLVNREDGEGACATIRLPLMVSESAPE